MDPFGSYSLLQPAKHNMDATDINLIDFLEAIKE